MKAIRKYKKGKKVLLIKKGQRLQKILKEEEEKENLKYKSSDFKMVSKSGVSYTDIVKKEKAFLKEKKSGFLKFIFVFILLLCITLFVLIRFRFINIDFKIFDSKINTSFLYNDKPSDIFDLLNEYKLNSYTEYVEENTDFFLTEKEGKDELNKYKEILENIKLEYKRKDIDKKKYKEEINLWAYNKPIFTNTFFVDEDTVIYDSLILNKKLKTNNDSFRKYLKNYYIYDYVIDKINNIENTNIEENEFIKYLLKNEDETNINPEIKYGEFSYERELKALKKVINNEKIKENIYKVLNLKRDEDKISININLKDEKIKEIIEKIKNNENIQNDIIEYLYIYLNRKPRYIFKEYSKNEIRELLNNLEKLEESFSNLNNINIIYYLNSYNTETKKKNKIQKVELNLDFKKFNLKLLTKKAYISGKDIKLSSKEELEIKSFEDIRSAENKILNKKEIEEREKSKINLKIQELKEEKTKKEQEKISAVIDSKNIRNKNKINKVIKDINKILNNRVKKDADLSKINIQEKVKKVILEEIQNGKKEYKINDLSFKLDITEDMKSVIYIIFNVWVDSDNFNVKANIKNNLIDINEYKYNKIN